MLLQEWENLDAEKENQRTLTRYVRLFFNKYDTDNSNDIDIDEWKRAMKILGCEDTRAEDVFNTYAAPSRFRRKSKLNLDAFEDALFEILSPEGQTTEKTDRKYQQLKNDIEGRTLAGLRLSDLRRRSKELGATQEEIDEALDTGDPKASLARLIVLRSDDD